MTNTKTTLQSPLPTSLYFLFLQQSNQHATVTFRSGNCSASYLTKMQKAQNVTATTQLYCAEFRTPAFPSADHLVIAREVLALEM